MKKIDIGLIGCGTVGSGVVKMLVENADIISSRVGVPLNLKYVADTDKKKEDDNLLPKGVFTTDAMKVVEDPDIDIILEMIGGEGIAKEIILKAIENKKQVVTANKALISAQGTKIFKAAFQKGVDIAFEASVGGCMPVVKTLRETLVGNRIKGIIGILNGTCNYILSKITDEGSDFESALSGAQANGYAEADPTLDVEGHDTAHKLTILNSLAYGMGLNLSDIYIEGISKITPMDIQLAQQFGYRIKLLAISKSRGKQIEARIHPTMIPFDNLLSNVNSSLNAVMISADAVSDIMLYGYGAGTMPTASAVISDTVDLARNLLCGSPGRIPLPFSQSSGVMDMTIMPMEEIETQYYFRFSIVDKPGVLSKISGILGDNNISLKSVQQKGKKTNGSVSLVMLTHLSREKDVKKSLAQIEKLDIVTDIPVLIRIEDENHK